MVLIAAVYYLYCLSSIQILTFVYACNSVHLNKGPRAVAFSVDRSLGRLEVEFDEPVKAASLLLPLLVLQDSPGTGANFSADPEHQIFFVDPMHNDNDLSSLGNVTMVPVYLSRDDFARLALHPFVARNASTSYLAMDACAILSAIGQCSEPVFVNESIPAASFLPDTAAPYVTGFAIDMQAELLYLNFSEPMDPESLDASFITIQNQSNVALSGAFTQLVDDDVVVFDVSDFQRQMVISLGHVNANRIKATKGLCTRSSKCFVSATGPIMNDVSSNPLTTMGFDRFFGMPCSNYSRDTTPPFLLDWGADLNRGEVYIAFTEPVHMPFFNYSSCLISNHADFDDSTNVMRVAWPLKFSFVNTALVNFTLQADQLDVLKTLSHTASSRTDLYLVLEPNIVTDTARLANAYRGVDATWNAARRISSLLLDSIDPDVVRVELNMMTRRLVITFSEIVDISTIDLREVQLQSSASVSPAVEIIYFANPVGPVKIDPAKASLVNTEDSNVMEITFSTTVFETLKTMTYLGRSPESTFLSMTYNFISDLAGNRVRPIPYSWARLIDDIVVDKSVPVLLQSAINLNTGTLDLYFSEPMDHSKFDLTKLFLSNDAVGTPATIVFYFGSDSYITKVQSDQIRIWMSASDLSYIKTVRPMLCSQSSDCLLTLEENFGFDASFVNSQGVLEQSPLAPWGPGVMTQFIGDTVPPFLLGYDINMEAGRMAFKFSEAIDANSFDASGISFFYSDYSTRGSPVQLSAHSFIEQSGFKSEVTLLLSRHDYWALQSCDGLATSRLSVLISLDANTCVDTFGNELDGSHNPGGSPGFVNGLALVYPNRFTAVTSPPKLIAVDFSGRQTWNVSLTFNQAIDPSTVVKSKIFVSSVGNVQKVALDGAKAFLTEKNSVVTLDMGAVAQTFDAFNKIGSDQSNLNVYLPLSGAIKSVYNMASTPVPAVNAIREGNVPVSFQLDLQSRKIRIEFSFPSAMITFSPTDVTLSRPSMGLRVEFTGCDAWRVDQGVYVEIDLSADDYNNIQSSVGLTELKEELYITLEPGAFVESSGRELGRSVTLPCLRLVSDTSNPALSHFDLHMGTGILDITFSKPILVSSFRMDSIYLVDSNSNPTKMVQLKQAIVLSSMDSSAILKLRIDLEAGPHPTDRDRIHFSQTIATSPSSTYIYIADGVITDTSFPRNFIRGLNFDSATRVSTFTADTIRPELLSFDLDMASRRLVLHFSEAVRHSVNIPAYYALRQFRDYVPGSFRELLTSTTLVPSNEVSKLSSDVTILLSDADVDYMMFLYPTVASSSTNSFLTVRPGAITDISYAHNRNVEIFDIYAVEPTIFKADLEPPRIVSYNFSIDDGLLMVELHEVVRCSATNPGAIILQYGQFIGTHSSFHVISEEETFIYPCTDDYSKIVSIQLSTEEVIKIKAVPLLFKTAESSWLRADRGAFVDVSGTPSDKIIDARAIQVGGFLGDETPPRLVAFEATVQGMLFLTFDEPIDVASLNVTAIVLRDSQDDEWYPGVEESYVRSYRLSDMPKRSYFKLLDQYNMYFAINLQYDQYIMDHLSSIFDTQDRSFMEFDANMATDTSGNQLLRSPDDKPIQAGPAVIFWELDMMNLALILVFTEDVESDFSPRGMIIQDYANMTGVNVELFTSSNFTYVSRQYLHPYSTLSAVLDDNDVLALRLSGLLEGPMFLSCDRGITTARSEISLSSGKYKSIIINASIALPISNYILDTRPPSILEYSIDLGSGVLTLFGSEPLDPDSLVLSKMSLLSFATGEIVRLSTPPTSVELQSPAVLDVVLGDIDLFAVKRAWTSGPLNGMLVEYGSISDAVGVNILANSLDTLIPMASFVPDNAPPKIVGFQYDAARRLVNVLIDEEIDLNAINPSSIILSDLSQPGGNELELSDYTLIIPGHVPRYSNIIKLDLYLMKVDAARVDNSATIGKDKGSTNIWLPPLTDVFGNQLVSTQFFPCTEYLLDYLSPELLSFDFSFSGTDIVFKLHFSEVIDISTFSCSDYSLISANGNEVAAFGSTVCTLISNIDSFEVSLSTPDSFLASFVTIGAAPYHETTFIKVSSAQPATSDKAMNAILTSPAGLKIPFGPRLVGSVLDMSLGSATIVFSSAVGRSPDKFLPHGLGFHSSISNKAVYLSSGSNAPIIDGIGAAPALYDYAVTLTFSPYDMDALRTLHLGRDLVSILLNAQSVFDQSGTPAQRIATPREARVTYFADDVNEPHLLSVVLDKSYDFVVFNFDEPVQSFGVDLTKLSIQNDAASASATVSLTGGKLEPLDEFGRAIKLKLNLADSTNIKLSSNILGNEPSDTFLSISFGCFSDYSGQFLEPTPRESAKQFTNVIPDTVAPQLDHFDVDMSAGTITFAFTEAIPISTFDLTEMKLQSASFVSPDGYSNASSFRFTGGTFLTGDGSTISVRMLPEDYEMIQSLDNLARRASSTLVTISAAGASDVAGNQIVPIFNGAALRCRDFISDIIHPRILSAAIDLNTAILTFVASEPINLKTVNAAYLIATNSITQVSIELSSTSVVFMPVPHMTTLDIQLSVKDFSKVQNILGPNKTALQISVRERFCQDTAGNSVMQGVMIPVLAPYKDVTPPVLEYYALDMSESAPVVTLVYSEALNPATLNFVDMNIQSYPIRKYGHFVRMGKATLLLGSGPLSSTVTLRIDESTANEMRRFGIGKDASTSLLSWGRTLAADFSGNFIEPVYDRSLPGERNNPVEPHLFVADVTQPELINWFFVLTSKEIHLRFTESVEIANAAGIGFTNTTGTPVFLTFVNLTVSYATEFGATVILSDLGEDVVALFSGPSEKMILVSSDAIRDRALRPNYVDRIGREHRFLQGGPGNIIYYMHYVLLTPKLMQSFLLYMHIQRVMSARTAFSCLVCVLRRPIGSAGSARAARRASSRWRSAPPSETPSARVRENAEICIITSIYY